MEMRKVCGIHLCYTSQYALFRVFVLFSFRLCMHVYIRTRSSYIYVFATYPVQYVLFDLNQPPHLHSNIGAPIPIVPAISASKLFPQPTPSFSYIPGANNGKLKPAIVRIKAAAPVADAEYVV